MGSSGLVGTDAVAKSPPAKTSFQINDTMYAMLPHAFKKLPWDHDKDMIAVTSIAQTLLVLVVSEKSPYKTMQDLVAFGKKNPVELNYASGGVGSSSDLGGELFKDAAKN